MNFQDLKSMVAKIKKDIICPKCKTHYIDENIEVIGAFFEEQFFFHAFCGSCNSGSMITVHLEPKNMMNVKNIKTKGTAKKLGSSPRIGHISKDEILDMHNFLKNFDGDFSSILSQKPKQS